MNINDGDTDAADPPALRQSDGGTRDRPDRYDAVIVGGGIAGLTAAWHLRDRHCLLIEASDRVGGRIYSLPRDMYWLNLGAHVFPSPESEFGRFIQELGIETAQIRANMMGLTLGGTVISSGSPAMYPLRLQMPPRARLSFARAGLKLRQAVREYAQLSRHAEGESTATIRARLLAYRDDESFSDFLGPLHPLVDAIFRAAINRVSAEPQELAAGAGVAQFAGTFSGRSNIYQYNIVGGSSHLTEALHARLGHRVRTGVTVRRIKGDTQQVLIEYEDTDAGTTKTVSSSCVIVGTPAHVTRRIIDDLPADVDSALGKIAYGPYVVAAFLTNEKHRMGYDNVYAIVDGTPNAAFNMFFNTVSIARGPGRRQPGGAVMVYASSDRARHLLEKSDTDIRESYLRDLTRIFPGVRGIIQEAVIKRWEFGIPFARPGRHEIQPSLERSLGRVILAGDYLGARGGTDEAAKSGQEAARAARSLLAATADGE